MRKKPRRKPKVDPTPKTKTGFDFSQYTGVVALLVIGGVFGFAKFGKWGDSSIPKPVDPVVEVSKDAQTAHDNMVSYSKGLASAFREVSSEIKDGKHETVTSWAASLFEKTEKAKKQFQKSTNSHIGPIAGSDKTTPATPELLEEVAKGLDLIK